MLTINGKTYDFIDFGASRGRSIEFAYRVLGGGNGLGIDINESKISYMKDRGYECIKADITNLTDIPDNSVKFVVISHLLEHLDSLISIESALNEAYRIASDFIFIQGPYYDADDYLEELGLRFYWSYWRGHTYHFKVSELKQILNKLPIYDYEVLLRTRIHDSTHSAIHSLNSPIDQHDYNSDIHPAKNIVQFESPVFREMVTFIAKRKLSGWNQLIHAKKDCVRADTLLPIKKARVTGTLRRLCLSLVWILKPRSISYIYTRNEH